MEIKQECVPATPAARSGIRHRRDGNTGVIDHLKAAVAGDAADAEDLGRVLRFVINADDALGRFKRLVPYGLANPQNVIISAFRDGLGRSGTPK